MERLVLIIFLSTVIASCKRENEFPYPLIQTGEVTDIDSTGVVFHARISDLGKTDILDYGFVWGLTDKPDINSSNVKLSGTPQAGIISQRVTSDLFPYKPYYVRAFARNDKYISYGRSVPFVPIGGIGPFILDFTPKHGSDGTQVTITGRNFSNTLAGNVVKFGMVYSIVTEASSEKLIVKLPNNLNLSGSVNLTILTSGRSFKSTETFRLNGCNILGFEPKSLKGGDLVKVKTEDCAGYEHINLFIGKKQANIVDIDYYDTLIAYVPYDADFGMNEVSLSVGSKTCYFKDSIYIKNPWSKVGSNYNFYRNRSSGFSIGENGYLGLGSNPHPTMVNECYNDLWRFNEINNTWSLCAEFPGQKREDAAAFSINGKGYVGLGSSVDGIFFNDIYEYDPLKNEWKKKADFPGLTRQGAAYFVINDKAYFGMGIGSGPAYLKDFWEYNPETDMWRQLSDYQGIGSFEMVGFTVYKKGFVGLGDGGPESSDSRDFWEYDPVSDEWTRLADFPGRERRGAAGYSISENGYVGMGFGKLSNDYYDIFQDFWRYDVGKNKWSRLSDIPYKGRLGSVSFIIGNKAYICSGINNDYQYGSSQESLIVFNPY